MKRLLAVVAALFAFCATPSAQTVSVVGPVTTGDCVQFSSNTVLRSSGRCGDINPTSAPYNAVCNGTQVVATANTVALQAAINAAIAQNRVLRINGGCIFDGNLTIAGSLTIEGNSDGYTGAYLAALTATQQMITVTTTDSVVFSNLTITSVVQKTGGWGIKFDTGGALNFLSRIENVHFSFQWDALNFVRAAQWRVQNAFFESAAPNATNLIANNTTGNDGGDNVIDNSTFSGEITGGTITSIDWLGGGGLTVSNSKFLGGAYALRVRLAGPVGGVGLLAFSNNSIEHISTAAISVFPPAGILIGDLLINGNNINSGGNSPPAIIDFGSGGGGAAIKRATVVGNTINISNATTTIGIRATIGANYTIVGNNIYTDSLSGTAIQTFAAVTNSLVWGNSIGVLGIDNASTSTLVFNSQAGGAGIVPAIGTPGVVPGRLDFAGSSSGATRVQGGAVASGVLTLPIATDTLVGKATADVFTNKTLNTNATGNVFQIAGSTITDRVTVPTGGTGLLAGTAGGVPYFNATTTMASSGVLTTNQLVIGGGTSGPVPLGSAGTTTTVLHGGASGPSFSAVSLTADVSNTLPIANGGTNDTGTAFTATTPTPACNSGTLTSASAGVHTKSLGKAVWVSSAVVNITTNGTCAGAVRVPLGFTAAIGSAFMCSDGVNSLQGQLLSGNNFLQIYTGTGTYPGADGKVLTCSGVMEST